MFQTVSLRSIFLFIVGTMIWQAAGYSRAEGLPQDFFNAHCIDCHNAAEAPLEVRLDNQAPRNWSDHTTSLFFERVLNAIRSERMPPPDAASLDASTRQVAVEALRSELMKQSAARGSGFRRLTRREYGQTIRKVFGIDFTAPYSFPSESPSEGFDDVTASLALSGPLMEAYYHSAIHIADRIVPPPHPPVTSRFTEIPADELVISYSSGSLVDDKMRLAARTDTMWRSSTWPEKFEVRTAGTYRIRVLASKFAPATAAWPEFPDPMRLQVRARSLNGRDGDAVSQQRLLAEFDVSQSEPKAFECLAELQPAETPIFYFANAPIDGVKGEQAPFGDVLRKVFANDPRLFAAWQQVEHGAGLRGGIGWDRVKKLRDSKELDVRNIDDHEDAIAQLVKKMTNNPGLYAETVVYQFYEEGPALQIHEVTIEGPITLVKSEQQKRQEETARRFLGEPGERTNKQYVRDFLREFLTKAFRRPPTALDIDEYTTIVLRRAEDASLRDGLHLAIRTALMSPKFLYRSYQVDRFDDFDLASRLAYFLTGGPPDDALFSAAEKGELSDAKILEEHTQRLLQAPTSDPFIADFTGKWLGTERLHEIMPDARLFPQFTLDHRQAMITETRRFFAEILRKNLTLQTLINPDFTFVNKPLGEDIYGFDEVDFTADRFQRVALPADSPYGGVLGQAGVMMATANGVDTQPVVRGVWVLDNILGDPPPPPPASVPALTPDTRGAKTVREMLAAHRSDTSCASCHHRIDPLGFVLESFDPVGRWRTHYPVITTNPMGKPVVKEGLPVETASDFDHGTALENVNDLKAYVLANIDDFSQCLSHRLIAYATGQPVSYAAKQEIKSIVERNRSRGNRFQDLFVSLIQSEAFRAR